MKNAPKRSNKSLLTKLRTTARKAFVEAHTNYLRWFWGMDIGPETRISLRARLDRTNPRGIHIGARTGIGSGAFVLTHDFINTKHVETRIGSNCHIGILAVILPGVTVGDHCIVAPGSVVMRDVPSGSLVSGNPARVLESGLELGPWGIRNWDGRR